MPQSLTYSGARVPLTTEADTVPADLLRFGTDIDQQLVLKATSQADRDARFANVSKSTLVSCAALGIVWQKKADGASGGWRVMAQSTDAMNTGVVTGTNDWSVPTQWGKVTNGFYSLYVTLTYSGSSDIVATDQSGSTPGGLVDTQIGTINTPYPPSWGPWVTDSRTNVTGCTVVIRPSDGAVIITDLPTAGRVRPGDSVTFITTYPVI